MEGELDLLHSHPGGPAESITMDTRHAYAGDQEPGVKIEDQSLDAIPTNPAFAPFTVNICEFPAK